MSDPEVLDRILQTCDYRFRTLQCPQHKKPADVAAAKWLISGDRWTSWTVIDCSLLPAGEIWCKTECLAQLDQSTK
ncbi:MAG TPA: hypothetical protein VE263_09225 [Candidatus Angelobacter sp.]|nr:hypothetical protein [Candidatus Angelobacter sp.]